MVSEDISGSDEGDTRSSSLVVARRPNERTDAVD